MLLSRYEWCAVPSYRTQRGQHLAQNLFGEVATSTRGVANVRHGVVVMASSALVDHRLYDPPRRSSTRLSVPDTLGTNANGSE